MKNVLIFIFLFIPVGIINAQNFKSIDSLLIEGDYVKAAKIGEEFCSGYPNNVHLNYKTGIAFKNLHQYKKAKFYIKKASLLDISDLKIASYYAEILYITGNQRLSVNKYNYILKHDENNIQALVKLGLIYSKSRKFLKAKDIYMKLVKLSSDNPYYYRQAAYCCFKLKEIKKSGNFYQTAYEIDSTDLKTIKQYAKFCIRSKQFDKSLQILEQGIKTDSLISDFHKYKAISLFFKGHNFRAIPEFLKVIELGDSSAEITRYTGIAYYKAFKYKNSEEYLISIYKNDTTDIEIVNYLGNIYYELKDYDKCISFLDKILELTKPDKKLMYNIYNIKAMSYFSKKEYNTAIKTFNMKFKYYKSKTYLDYYNLALMYDKAKKSKTAVSNYEKFLGVYPDLLKRDCVENKMYNYAEKRIKKIKEKLHFEGKLTN